MEIYENAMVTLQYVKYQVNVDVELPSTVPLGKMLPKIKQLLGDFSTGFFPEHQEITIFHQGKPLREQDSLAARQIWDGSILEVKDFTR